MLYIRLHFFINPCNAVLTIGVSSMLCLWIFNFCLLWRIFVKKFKLFFKLIYAVHCLEFWICFNVFCLFVKFFQWLFKEIKLSNHLNALFIYQKLGHLYSIWSIWLLLFYWIKYLLTNDFKMSKTRPFNSPYF